MKRHALLVLAGIGGMAVASLPGCGGKQSLSSSTGLGGAAGRTGGGSGGSRTRGSSGAGGLADGGGALGADGGIATGPASPGLQTTCIGADGGIMGAPDGAALDDSSDAGACASLPADAPAFPWTIEPQLTAGAPVDAAGTSGCRTALVSGEVVDVVCSGAAWLRPNGGAGGSGGNVPSVTWDDGSRLSWQPAGLDPAIPPPIAPGAADQRVWAALESHGWLAISGQCGWAWDQSMEVRDAPGGKLRFMARQGAGEPEPSDDDLLALFGVRADAVTWCTHDAVGGPARFHQSLREHVLGTSPPQVIPYGQATQVTTPSGPFAVLWYSRAQVAHPLSGTCEGCLSQGPIVAFVASPSGS